MIDNGNFIRAICANPFDLGPRLVWSDWLEEQGEADRAEFVRVQIALSGCKRRARTCKNCGGDGWVYEDYAAGGRESRCDRCKGKGYRGGTEKSWLLGKREEELLDRWVDGREGSNCKWWIGGIQPVANRRDGFHGGWLNGKAGQVEFRRGMIERVRTTCKIWLDAGPEIVQKWPVVEVELSDREPNLTPLGLGTTDLVYGFGWSDEYAVPIRFAKTAQNHSTVYPKEGWDLKETAITYLSRLCVCWARDESALPPIKWPA